MTKCLVHCLSEDQIGCVPEGSHPVVRDCAGCRGPDGFDLICHEASCVVECKPGATINHTLEPSFPELCVVYAEGWLDMVERTIEEIRTACE